MWRVLGLHKAAGHDRNFERHVISQGWRSHGAIFAWPTWRWAPLGHRLFRIYHNCHPVLGPEEVISNYWWVETGFGLEIYWLGKQALPCQFFPPSSPPKLSLPWQLPLCPLFSVSSPPASPWCCCICLYLLVWLCKAAHPRAWAVSQGSQALPCIVSVFLFGRNPCDFHALEDLGPCEISSGELATWIPCFVSASSVGRRLYCFLPTSSHS